MQYNKFIQSSYATIKNSRQAGLTCKTVENLSKIPSRPQNVYIQIWIEKGKQKIKIEQWNFKCLKTLIESQYEQDQDPQLDSVEFSKKSYTTLLEQSLVRFNPKLLIRSIEPKQITFLLTTSETNIKPFSQPHVFFIFIDEYEGNGFNCRVSLQTVHTEMNRKKQLINLESDQEEFIDLVDSSCERERAKLRNSTDKKPETSPQLSQNPTWQKKQSQKQQTRKQEAEKSPQTQKNISAVESPQQKQSQINRSHKEMVNMLLSKCSTKQIKVSDYERKMQLLNQTIQLIDELNFKNDVKLGSFLQKLTTNTL